jgi:hypothetical protein
VVLRVRICTSYSNTYQMNCQKTGRLDSTWVSDVSGSLTFPPVDLIGPGLFGWGGILLLARRIDGAGAMGGVFWMAWNSWSRELFPDLRARPDAARRHHE